MTDDIEKDLENFQFTSPPEWLRARSLVAAESVLMRRARKRRRKYFAVAALATGISIVAVGTYIADAIAPIVNKASPTFSYPPSPSVTMGPDGGAFGPIVAPAGSRIKNASKTRSIEARMQKEKQEKPEDEKEKPVPKDKSGSRKSHAEKDKTG